VKTVERNRKSFGKALALDSPLVGKLITKLLALSKNRNTRMVARLGFIFASSTCLFLLIPFYPVYIALLFGAALGALGIRYPRGALALSILLSIPSAVYQEIAETPLLIAYLLVCILPLAATTTRWVNGFLVLVSIELAFIPQLCFLSFLPILIAGLALSARDGATTGLCASLAIIFLLIIGGPISGLIGIGYRVPQAPSFQTPLMADFKPVSIAETFWAYANTSLTNSGDANSPMAASLHWLKALKLGGIMFNAFLNDIYPWIIPALWCISGYLAFKTAQWYRKLTSFNHVLASLTITAFPVAGGLASQTPYGAILTVATLTAAGLVGLALNIFYVQKERNELTNQASAIGSRLGKIGLAIKDISILGINTEEHETRMNGLHSNVSSVAILCQDRKLSEASALVKTLEQDTKRLEEETTMQRTKLVEMDRKSKEVRRYLEEAQRKLGKAKRIFARSEMSDEEKELDRIRKGLTEAQHLARTGGLAEASSQLERLLKDSEAVQADVSEILELWVGLPVWTSAIETKLTEEGKANVQAIEAIPPKWRGYVLDRFMKEKSDMGLELKNGILHLPKTKPPAALTHEQSEASKAEMQRVKPTPPHVVDSIVLDYIRTHGGTVSLSRAAKDLNLTRDQLDASIKRLKDAGVMKQ